MDGRMVVLEDVARAEKAEQELDAFITRRALKANPEQRRVEELWEETSRKHNAKHREECLRERLGYHRTMLEAHTRNFEELLRRHRVGLRLCEEALGLPISEETKGAA